MASAVCAASEGASVAYEGASASAAYESSGDACTGEEEEAGTDGKKRPDK